MALASGGGRHLARYRPYVVVVLVAGLVAFLPASKQTPTPVAAGGDTRTLASPGAPETGASEEPGTGQPTPVDATASTISNGIAPRPTTTSPAQPTGATPRASGRVVAGNTSQGPPSGTAAVPSAGIGTAVALQA